MLLFRAGVEWTITEVVGLDEPEAFESLSATIRFGLPIIGALLIAVFYERLGASSSQVGIPSSWNDSRGIRQACQPERCRAVLWRNRFARKRTLARARRARSSSRCPRGSVIGERFKHHNTTRILQHVAPQRLSQLAQIPDCRRHLRDGGCIDGVHHSHFTPVIVASVTAARMSRAAYGTAAAFDVPALEMGSLFEPPFLIFVGAAIGTLAAAFTWTVANLKQRASQYGYSGVSCSLVL